MFYFSYRVFLQILREIENFWFNTNGFSTLGSTYIWEKISNGNTIRLYESFESTYGAWFPSILSLYLSIALLPYRSLISLYGLTDNRMLPMYV